jgi:uncharacterized protein (TIGR02246 family)
MLASIESAIMPPESAGRRIETGTSLVVENLAMKNVLAAPIFAMAMSLPLLAAEPPDTAQEEAAIRETVKSYVAAFNARDAEALAAYWSEDCEFVTPAGDLLQGRQAIQAAFSEYFKKNEGVKLQVAVDSVNVLGPEVAVEKGTSQVIRSDGSVSETSYAARYAKEDGKWKLKTLREADKAPSHYEHLKLLEWMIGEWVDADGDSIIRTSCKWTKNKNFITRSFTVSAGDLVALEGTQVIGWAPDKEVIRSWLFDSDGGTGVGVWSQQGDRWTIRTVRILPDGRKGSSVNVITQIDENSFTWKSTSREVDGDVLPSIGPVTITRTTDN